MICAIPRIDQLDMVLDIVPDFKDDRIQVIWDDALVTVCSYHDEVSQ